MFINKISIRIILTYYYKQTVVDMTFVILLLAVVVVIRLVFCVDFLKVLMTC